MHFIIVVISLLRGRCFFFLFSTFSKWAERGSPFQKVAHPDEDESKGHTLKTVKIVGKHHAHLRDGTRLIYLTVYFINFRFVHRFPFWPLRDMEQIKTNSFACSAFKKKKSSALFNYFFFLFKCKRLLVILESEVSWNKEKRMTQVEKKKKLKKRLPCFKETRHKWPLNWNGKNFSIQRKRIT